MGVGRRRGLSKDSCSRAGHHRAFHSAEGLSEAIHAACRARSDGRAWGVSARAATSARPDVRASRTAWRSWSSAAARKIQALLFGAAHESAQADRSSGALAGTVPIPEFFSPDNMQAIFGQSASHDGAADPELLHGTRDRRRLRGHAGTPAIHTRTRHQLSAPGTNTFAIAGDSPRIAVSRRALVKRLRDDCTRTR